MNAFDFKIGDRARSVYVGGKSSGMEGTVVGHAVFSPLVVVDFGGALTRWKLGPKDLVKIDGPRFGGGYIILDVTDSVLSGSEKPRVHPTIAAAEAEAERLAKKFPGTEFIVFHATSSTKAPVLAVTKTSCI